MSSPATSASRSAPPAHNVLPGDMFREGALASSMLPNTHGRGRSLVRSMSVRFAYAVIDAILVCCAGGIAAWLRFDLGFPFSAPRLVFDQTAAHTYFGFLLLYTALILLGCANQDLYRTARDQSVLEETLKVIKAVGTATILLAVFVFATGYRDISRLVVFSAGALSIINLAGWRYFKRQLVCRRALAEIGVSRVLIVGAGRMGRALAHLLKENRNLGYVVCGFLDSKPSDDADILGTLDDLRSVAITQFVDELFITLPLEREFVKKTVMQARELRLGLKLLPDIYDGLGWHAPLQRIGGFPVMNLQWHPIPAVGHAVKRIMDVVLGSLVLILSTPLLVVLAFLIRLDSPGRVLYVAERLGRKGRKFRCYKLRTMVNNADDEKEKLRTANERQGPFFKIENDPRITRIGRWLRKASLDELPQLWNVIRGDMSLVGPRPHPLDDCMLYSIEHLRRLDVRPGLTGLWQVTARRDPSFDTNLALDLEYIENWNLALDLKILLQTVPAVFRAEGS